MSRMVAVQLRGGSMLERLKSFDTDAMDVEQMVALSAFGRSVSAEFEQFGDAPEWIAERLTTLRRAIKAAMADKLAAQMKEIDLQLGHLRTKEEVKSSLVAQRATLAAKLQGVGA